MSSNDKCPSGATIVQSEVLFVVSQISPDKLLFAICKEITTIFDTQ